MTSDSSAGVTRPAVTLAVVGLGWWGLNMIGQLRDSDRVCVVVGVDPDPLSRERAQALGVETELDFAAMLGRPDVDAVVICSPHRLHAEQIIAAARVGKHVFCEKPFCTNVADADAALAAVAAAGVQVGIGHERRFEPAIVEMQRRFADGDLGAIVAVEGNFSQDKFLALAPDNWRLSTSEAPVGPLSATGIHLVDLAISLLGGPTEVWARLSTQCTTFANGDTLTVTLGFDAGRTALITAVLCTPFIGQFRVLGSHGWMEIRDRSHPEQPTGWDVTVARRGSEPEHRYFAPHPCVRDNLERFAEAISGGRPYPVSVADIRANVQAFEAISTSARTGQIEYIPSR